MEINGVLQLNFYLFRAFKLHIPGSYTCVADYGTATVAGTVTTLAIKGM